MYVMCLAWGGVGGVGAEWIRGFDFPNHVGLHGRLAQKTVNRAPISGGGCFGTICTAVCQNRCDSYITCRMCRFKP